MMLQVLTFAVQSLRHPVPRRQIIVIPHNTKRPPDRLGGCPPATFIQSDAHLGLAHRAQIDPLDHRRGHHRALQRTNFHVYRVKKRFWRNLKTCRLKPFGQADGFAMNALRNCFQTFGTVEHRIKGRHYCQQRLRSAYVRGRFLTAYMLFAGLERQAVGPVAIGIDRHSNDASRHRPLEHIFGRHIRRMRATITHRHAKPLGAANCNIGLHSTGFFQQSQRQRIGTDNPNGFGQMQRRDMIGKVLNMAVGARILENRTKHLRGI